MQKVVSLFVSDRPMRVEVNWQGGCGSVVRPGRSAIGAVGVAVAMALTAWGAVAVAGRRPGADNGGTGQLEVVRPHVVVVKSKRKLYLFDNNVLVRTYDVGLGWAPVGQKLKSDDGRTPEGRFRIRTKNAESKYRSFLGLSYPDPAAAIRGLREGLISNGEFASILASHNEQRCPPWTTTLGGGIGIHGCGSSFDWTAGCIALADRDAEELFDVLRLGDEVEILP